MKKRRKKTKIGKTGCLFWLLVLLIVVIIFLYKGKGSFKGTIGHLKKLIAKNKTEEIIKKKTKSNQNVEQKTIEKKIETTPKSTTNETEKTKKPEPLTSSKEGKIERESKKITPEIKTKVLITSIYFIKIELDGSAKPYPIKRKVQFRDSPITMTINTLLKGPAPSERKKGILSFIPKGTKLLSATLKNGNLTLDFNEAIEENYSGKDAIILELLQILYTSFEFRTVKSTSILINSQKKQYITGGGIPLKSKYIRSDLSKLWN